VGERTGTIPPTLRKIAAHREKAGRLRAEIIGKLSYPVLLMTIGSGVIAFLLIFVVPVFESTYNEAGVPLPMVTQLLIAVGAVVERYGWLIVAAPVLIWLGLRQLRKNKLLALKIDQRVLQLPLFGNWLRDISVLQLMDVLGNLMEAGFTLPEALGASVDLVRNHAVKRSISALQLAVERGERFSREIERMGEMFPPIVSQLVIVGEQTGHLATAAGHIRSHLEEEINRKTSILVGTLEPVLTLSLAAAIGIILLAIYLPMFDMISTVGG
jgi:type IV pilus assembly protein PilC